MTVSVGVTLGFLIKDGITPLELQVHTSGRSGWRPVLTVVTCQLGLFTKSF